MTRDPGLFTATARPVHWLMAPMVVAMLLFLTFLAHMAAALYHSRIRRDGCCRA